MKGLGIKPQLLLQGGLGNQIFQYIAGKYLELSQNIAINYNLALLDNSRSHSGDLSDFSNILNEENLTKRHHKKNELLTIQGFDWVMSKFPKTKRLLTLTGVLYEPKEIGYIPNLEIAIGFRFIRGYFQTYQYYDYLKSSLNFDLAAKIRVKAPSDEFIRLMQTARQNPPIVFHIRRGDYQNNRNSIGMLNQEYFVAAAAKIDKELADGPVWIFSDDSRVAMELASILKTQFDINMRITVVPNHLKSVEIFNLMTTGKIHIISNSTFGWWAAELSTATTQIICPTPWFRGLSEPHKLIRKEWVRQEANWHL